MVELAELEAAYEQALAARAANKNDETVAAVNTMAERVREARRQTRLTQELAGDRSLILIQEEGQ